MKEEYYIPIRVGVYQDPKGEYIMDGHIREEQKKRLARIEGQLRGIIRMMDENKTCEEILTQMSAVENAVRGAAREILKDHLNHCVMSSIERGEKETLIAFNKILDKYLR